jgi:hypothetical protein
VLGLMLVLPVWGAFAAPAVPPVDEALMRETIRALASDAYEGRGPGTAAEPRTLEAIIARFKAAGLQPGNTGPDGKPMRMKALNVFFYAGSEGVTTPDYYDHVLLSYLHALTRNLNHRWALVSFYMPYSEAELGKADPMAELGAMEDLRQFASEAAMEILQPLVD